MPSAPRRQLTAVVPLVEDQGLEVVPERRLALRQELVRSRLSEILETHLPDRVTAQRPCASEPFDDRAHRPVDRWSLRRDRSRTISRQQFGEVARQRLDLQQGQQVDVSQEKVTEHPRRVLLTRRGLQAALLVGYVLDQRQRLLPRVVEGPDQHVAQLYVGVASAS